MDLDNLLEDVIDDAGQKGRVVSKAKKVTTNDDDWGDLDFDEPKPVKRAGTSVPKTSYNEGGSRLSPPGRYNKIQQSFGFGGPDGLKKEPKKAEDDDDDWGDLGAADSKGGGRLLGRKPKKDDDDDFENLIDGMVGSKPKAEEPEPPKARPRTAAVRNTASWGRGDDELEDVDDAGSQAPSGTGSHKGPSDEALAARRRALFGGGPVGSQADAPKPAKRAQTATRPAQVQQEKPATGFGLEQPALGDGNASIGSQGSGIELLEVPNSRTRRMIRPPPGGSAARPSRGNDASGASNPPSLRPPSGPDSGVNQIQELHQNNRLVRPDTGNVRKPPKGNAFDPAGEEAATLDLLAESQHAASNAGSHVSGTAAVASATANTRLGSQEGARRDHLGVTGSHADFDRAEEDIDLDAELANDPNNYSSPEDEGGSDSDEEGGYQPTLIARSSQNQPKKKKKKKAAQVGTKSPPKAGGVEKLDSGLASPGKGQLATIGSAGSGQLKKEGGQSVQGRPTGPESQREQILFAQQPKIKVRPTDPKGALEYDIEMEQEKSQKMEQKYRDEMDKVRRDHAAAVAELEAKHTAQKQRHEDERQKLQADKNAAIEESKQKLIQLHKIDLDGRDLLYTKDLDNQRALFEDQQQNLRRQLQERREIKELAKEINDSSGNINSLVAQIGTANQGELQRREAEITRKEKLLAEKRQLVAERRRALQSRKEKLRQEFDEIQQRENETRVDFQRAKGEIAAEVDRFELEYLQEKRAIKDKVVEAEVEARRVVLECERITNQIEKAKDEHNSKLDEWDIEKERIRQAQENFKVESERQQRELTEKLRTVQSSMKSQIQEEQEFDQKLAEYEEEHNKVVRENDALQEELDKYCIEKETLERQTQQLKDKGERDQLESEKIGYFKAHKERLYEELKQWKADLETEKQQLSEDTIKHQIFKNQIATKQKTLETMRYNYIKGDQQETVQRAEFIASAKNRFVPINPPVPQPTQSVQNNFQGPSAPLSAAPSAPRFNYDDYMKSLNARMAGAAPQSTTQGGADFQAYLMREREDYLKSVHQFEKDTPLIQSLARLREREASKLGENYSNVGDTLVGGRALQTESVNSLQYMSAGLSER